MRNYVVMAVEYPLYELLSHELMGGLRFQGEQARNQTPTARGIKVRVRYIEHSFFDRDGMAKQKDQAIDGEMPAT